MFYRFNQSLGFTFFREQIALIPSWNRVMKSKAHGEEAMKWLFAIYDVRSALQNKYPKEKDRIVAANKKYFNKTKIGWEDEPMIIEAMDDFRDMFWDSDFIQMQVYDEQIVRLTNELRNSTSPTEIRELGKALKEINELRDIVVGNLEYKLKDGTFDNLQFKKGRGMSMLVKVMEEKKQEEKVLAE